MKTIHAMILAGLGLGVAVSSCSDIDEGDRFTYFGSVESIDASKHVLIEDFTGQRCVNCPAATDLIRQMQESYGEGNLIAVGIYSGPFGSTVSGRYFPLTTETGNHYYDGLGASTQPIARIDRGAPNDITATWPTEVYECMQKEATMGLAITNAYDEGARTVGISVDATAFSDVDGRLQVWVTEDGIVSRQDLADGSTDNDYVHDHVFRAAVNDIDGEAIHVAGGETETRSFSMALDAEWVAENMSVVAFVFNDDGVLQVTKAPVVQPGSGEGDDEGQ